MMLRRAAAGITCAVIWGFSIALPIKPALADTPLNRAVIEALRNQVRLLQQNRSARPANVSDTLTPGDGVATGQLALAELRFNDGSLARMGEQVVFWFTPQNRTFRLSNGTMLMLIPPGQGNTRIRTPNVTAGIRGSALFVRVNEESNTTFVGALTNSGIEVFNANGTERQELQAGQMAVVVNDRIEGLYEFDLDTFYQTSPLVEGLKLGQVITPAELSTRDPNKRAVLAVREETVAALQAQEFASDDVISAPVLTDENVIAPVTTLITATEIMTLDDIINESAVGMEADVMSNPAAQVYDNERPSEFPGGGATGGNFPGRGGGSGGVFPPSRR